MTFHPSHFITSGWQGLGVPSGGMTLHTARKWVQESLSHRGSIQVEMHMPRASLSKVQKEEVNAMMPTIREKGTPIHPLDETIKERESESLQREV